MSTRSGTVRFLGVALIALVVGFALGYFVPHASPSTPAITPSSSSVKAGAQYTVKLSGFPANTDIYGWVVNENPPRTFNAGTTDARGELSLTSNAPQTPGTWLLCASDENNETWAETILAVT